MGKLPQNDGHPASLPNKIVDATLKSTRTMLEKAMMESTNQLLSRACTICSKVLLIFEFIIILRSINEIISIIKFRSFLGGIGSSNSMISFKFGFFEPLCLTEYRLDTLLVYSIISISASLVGWYLSNELRLEPLQRSILPYGVQQQHNHQGYQLK